jgi:uncharacterized protein (DUF885 family)
MKKLFFLIFLWLTPAMGIAQQPGPTESDRLQMIISDHWRNWLSENPFAATGLGVRTHDQKVPDYSLVAMDKAAAKAEDFKKRLKAIRTEDLSSEDRVNHSILLRLLNEQIRGNQFGQRMMTFTSYSSAHQGFAGLGDSLPFDTKADYESYLNRLSQFPKVNADIIAIDQQAIAKGFVQPCVTLNGFEKTISGPVDGAPETTRFFEPFKRARPNDMTEAEWAAAKSQATTIIRDVLTPEYKRYLDHYTRNYKPKCAKVVGASALPQGREYYAFRAQAHTTTDQSPDTIHQIGLNEVQRILARMDAVAKQAGFADRKSYVAELRRNPKYYAKTPAELMAAASHISKIIDGKMPQYFNTLPRLPYGLREIPKEIAETTTTAYYNPGSAPSGIAGYYYVNTSKLDQRPLFELPALTVHEAVPGHHHQIALQQELKLPEFRKHASGFTAFVEGWALYTEYLGEEIGIYDSPEKMMGRLSYEMWRASRLVVDTGLHAKGWSKERAIAFMLENTALSPANIEAEVNRYISWPGQALGYKLGEIFIRDQRAKAQKALGAKFNLRRFHDVVLTQGAVPLDVLQRQVDDWVASEIKKDTRGTNVLF